MFGWFTDRRCDICRARQRKDSPTHELQLETADGMMLLDVCEACSITFEEMVEEQLKPKTKK